MSNFGDSSNYESYPYYEPTSQSVQMSSQSDMSNWQRAGWHTQPQNHTAFRKTANGDDPNKSNPMTDNTISPPMGLDQRGSFRSSQPIFKQAFSTTSYQDHAYQSFNETNELKKRIAHLEWRQRRVEEENEFLFNENQKMKTSYSAALDQLAKQLVKALVQQQITEDQLIFNGVQTGSYQNDKRSRDNIGRGILKPSGPSPTSSPFLPFKLESTAAPELSTEGPSNADKLVSEYLMDEEMAKAPSIQNINMQKANIPPGINYPIQLHSPLHTPQHNPEMVRPPMMNYPFNVINRPIDVMSAIHSPRHNSQNKKVWFGNDAVSVGAKSAPAGKLDLPDTESECSDRSESDRTSASSNGSDRNLNNESLVTDINNIVKQQNGYRDHNWSKKTESIRSEPGQKLSMVSPGSQRWNLQRKDSIHSLASEPAKIDNVTPFQRGAKSHTSLHRFRIKESKKASHQDRHSSSIDRSLSPSSNKHFYDQSNRGTPPSLAIPAGIKPHSARELNFNNKSKKKKSFLDIVRAKFTGSKKKEGIERVETPTGQWLNRSFSPTKSDTDSNSKLNRPSLKTTPGRKSIG